MLLSLNYSKTYLGLVKHQSLQPARKKNSKEIIVHRIIEQPNFSINNIWIHRSLAQVEMQKSSELCGN